jgi:hypothetical protein
MLSPLKMLIFLIYRRRVRKKLEGEKLVKTSGGRRARFSLSPLF